MEQLPDAAHFVHGLASDAKISESFRQTVKAMGHEISVHGQASFGSILRAISACGEEFMTQMEHAQSPERLQFYSNAYATLIRFENALWGDSMTKCADKVWHLASASGLYSVESHPDIAPKGATHREAVNLDALVVHGKEYPATEEGINQIVRDAASMRKDPEAIHKMAKDLWEQRGDLTQLVDSNILQGKVLRLYEAAADAFLAKGLHDQATSVHIESLKSVSYSASHTLHNIAHAIGENSFQRKLPDGTNCNLGAHFSSLDSTNLKGANLHAVQKEYPTGTVTQFTFELTHHARPTVDRMVAHVESQQKQYQDAGIQVAVKNSSFTYEGMDDKGLFGVETSRNRVIDKTAKEIVLEGIGRVVVPQDKAIGTTYNRIQVHLEAGKSLEDLQTALSMIGLGSILATTTSEDRECHKIWQLFRAYEPSAALSLERNADFHNKSPAELLKAITEKSPQMEKIFANELKRVGFEEVLPGKLRVSIPSLVEEVQQGCMGFMHEIGTLMDDKTLALRLAGTLCVGLLSSQQRFQAGMTKYAGESSFEDHKTGGADSCFMRYQDRENLEFIRSFASDEEEVEEAGGFKELFLGISPDVVKLNPYQYAEDNYGVRNLQNPKSSKYESRMNLLEFRDTMQSDYSSENEVMVKDRVAPKFIRGVYMSKNMGSVKEKTVEHLRKLGYVTTQEGRDFLQLDDRQIAVDEFFVMGGNIALFWDKVAQKE